MGAWGAGSFENDEAFDWLGLVEVEDDIGLVDEALAVIVDAAEEDYLDADDCSDAIAAAEVVAAMGGRPSPHLPDGVKAWCEAQEPPEAELVKDALAALDRIRAGSELLELWSESGAPDPQWLKSLDGLVERLRGAATAEG